MKYVLCKCKDTKLYYCFWSRGFPYYAWVGTSATQFAMKTEVVASISEHSNALRSKLRSKHKMNT